MSLTRRFFLGALAVAPFAIACTKQSTVGAPAHLTSAHAVAGRPSLPMLLAESAARDATIAEAKRQPLDRLGTRLRGVLAPVEEERRAFLNVLAEGATAGKLDKPACFAAIETIEASVDKAAPYLRDAVVELHHLLDKKQRVRVVNAAASFLGTVDAEPGWIQAEELHAVAAELELRPGKRWSALRRNEEVARRYRSPLTNPTPIRSALDAFEETDAEEAAWLVVKQTSLDAVEWAKRMVILVDDLLFDLDPLERGRLASWLRASRDRN